MSDLISREDAIELLTSRILSSKGIFGDLGGAVSGVRELIKAMPSAEPERRWIPVSERLPEDGARVLTTIETERRGKQVRSGTYFQGYFNNDNGDTWNAKDKEVLAWMPQPEPWERAEMRSDAKSEFGKKDDNAAG